MNINTSELRAYALGYYHGRDNGNPCNPYQFEDTKRHWYNLGYDAGVADYCAEIDQAENDLAEIETILSQD